MQPLRHAVTVVNYVAEGRSFAKAILLDELPDGSSDNANDLSGLRDIDGDDR